MVSYDYKPQEIAQDGRTESTTSSENTSITKSEVKEEKKPENIFTTLALRQTSFDDDYGGFYGGYEIELKITANGGDILIPMTTTNSRGASFVSFSYKITGGDFEGDQSSKITCSRKNKDGYCKVRDGYSSVITTTVWLVPDSEGEGNYGIEFEDINYYQNGEIKNHSLNEVTQRLNLSY